MKNVPCPTTVNIFLCEDKKKQLAEKIISRRQHFRFYSQSGKDTYAEFYLFSVTARVVVASSSFFSLYFTSVAVYLLFLIVVDKLLFL